MKIISVNKLFVGILAVTSLLVVPTHGQDDLAFLAPILNVVLEISSVGFIIINFATGLVGIDEKLSFQSLLAPLIDLLVPDVTGTVLDGICTPLKAAVGDVGDCSCSLLTDGGETDVTIGISCAGTEEYCFSGTDILTCGAVSVSGRISIPLSSLISAATGSDISLGADPEICVKIDEGEDESVCASGEINPTVSISDPDSFDPSALVVENPSVRIDKGEDTSDCSDVSEGCDDTKTLSFSFNCVDQSTKFTQVQCLGF